MTHILLKLNFTESSSPNVHGGRTSRYHEIDYAIRKWPNGIAYYAIDSSLGGFPLNTSSS